MKPRVWQSSQGRLFPHHHTSGCPSQPACFPTATITRSCLASLNQTCRCIGYVETVFSFLRSPAIRDTGLSDNILPLSPAAYFRTSGFCQDHFSRPGDRSTSSLRPSTRTPMSFTRHPLLHLPMECDIVMWLPRERL